MENNARFWSSSTIGDVIMIVGGILILGLNNSNPGFTLLECSIVFTVLYRFFTNYIRYRVRKEGYRFVRCTVLEKREGNVVKYTYNSYDLDDIKVRGSVKISSTLVKTRYHKLKAGEDIDVLMATDEKDLRELPVKRVMTVDLAVLIILTLLTVGCFVNYLV